MLTARRTPGTRKAGAGRRVSGAHPAEPWAELPQAQVLWAGGMFVRGWDRAITHVGGSGVLRSAQGLYVAERLAGDQSVTWVRLRRSVDKGPGLNPSPEAASEVLPANAKPRGRRVRKAGGQQCEA